MPYYEVIPISPWHWRFTNENEGVYADLLVGQQKALVIDTCYGIGDLYAQVRELTSLPLELVNTHGHGDHSHGNYQFPVPAMVGEADLEFCRQSSAPEQKEYFLSLVRGFPKGFSVEQHKQTGIGELIPIREGKIIDLGGLQLEVFETPGHTRGSISLYDRAHREIYTGDAFNQCLLIRFDQSAPLSVYEQSLHKVMALDFDTIYSGHKLSDPKAALKIRQEVVDICRDPKAPVIRDPSGVRVVVPAKYTEQAKIVENDQRALAAIVQNDDFHALFVDDAHNDLL